ncbi:MAG: class I SAM-dependent methyltransferase [Rhodospirillales bacterium]|nr:class I SAM-dependent methyltransferase [Rhodospirillales bacterium]
MNLTKESRIPLIGWAVVSMVIGTSLAFLAAMALQTWADIGLSLAWVCLAGGLIAAVLGQLIGLPFWWVPLNLGLPVAAYFSLSATIPAWIYLACFIGLALMYWNSARERVPLYLSNPTTWQALAQLIQTRDGTFLDLGCGLGGTLFYLASRYPQRRFVGIESAPLPYAFAKLKQCLLRRTNVTIRYGDFWKLDFASYQTIYAFLSPAPMARLYEKVSDEMPSGGQFISNSFGVPDVTPDETQSLNDSRQTNLLIWRFKQGAEKVHD